MLCGAGAQPCFGRACCGPAGVGRTPACQCLPPMYRRFALHALTLGVLLCEHAPHQLRHRPTRTEAAAGGSDRAARVVTLLAAIGLVVTLRLVHHASIVMWTS